MLLAPARLACGRARRSALIHSWRWWCTGHELASLKVCIHGRGLYVPWTRHSLGLYFLLIFGSRWWAFSDCLLPLRLTLCFRRQCKLWGCSWRTRLGGWSFALPGPWWAGSWRWSGRRGSRRSGVVRCCLASRGAGSSGRHE